MPVDAELSFSLHVSASLHCISSSGLYMQSGLVRATVYMYTVQVQPPTKDRENTELYLEVRVCVHGLG